MTMSIKELQELFKLIKRNSLTEFAMKDGDFEITIRSEHAAAEGNPTIQQVMPVAAPTYLQQAPAPQAAPPAAAPATGADGGSEDAAPPANDSKLIPIKSPMVGTFYRASSPDKPPFAKVGDSINVGDVVCIVEAMKLFNEIESEVSGKIVKVLVEDAQPIEYDQVLFMVEP